MEGAKGKQVQTTQQLKRALTDGTPAERLHASHLIMANLDEHLPWLAKRTLIGLTISKKDDGWLMIVRAKRGRQPQVSFHHAATLDELWLVTAWWLFHDLARWRNDKYRAMRSD